MNGLSGTIRTQVCIAAEDYAFLKDHDLTPSKVLAAGIQAERALRTPEKMLALLDEKQEVLDAERNRITALIKKRQLQVQQENSLDTEILKYLRQFPQCPTPPPAVMSAIWGWVREHEDDMRRVLDKYTTNQAIKDRIATTWLAHHHRIAEEAVKAADAKLAAPLEKKGGA